MSSAPPNPSTAPDEPPARQDGTSPVSPSTPLSTPPSTGARSDTGTSTGTSTGKTDIDDEIIISGATLARESLPTPTPLVPELSRTEQVQVARRTAISAVVVHEAIREEGERELARPILALAASGLAAGLSMGFSLITQGLFHDLLPKTAWAPVIASVGYSVGFLIVVLGRQQLFTENTLTVILPLLAQPRLDVLWKVLRLWGVVLVANLIGAFIVATVMAHTGVFAASITPSFVDVSQAEVSTSFGVTVVRGIFAGWLIALMVWLLPSAETARLWIIVIITYVVALGKFTHIIAGAVSALYLVSLGQATWATAIGRFLIPTLIGNIVGGVSLVAALNFAQVSAERKIEKVETTHPGTGEPTE